MSATISLGPVPSDCFIVSLTRENGGRFSVQSVRVVTGDLESKYSFTDGRSLERSFVPEFVTALQSIRPRRQVGEGLVHEPEFSFSMPGFGVSGVHVSYPSCAKNVGLTELHFRRYVGEVSRMFLFEPSMPMPSASVRERIAVEVLRDIVSPIFDMLTLAKVSSQNVVVHHSSAIQARLDRLASHQEELEFFTGLLKRYVAGCQQDAASVQSPSESRVIEKSVGS